MYTCSHGFLFLVYIYLKMEGLFYILTFINQAWWHPPVIPVFRSQKQEDLCKPEVNLISIVSFRPPGAGYDTRAYLKTPKQSKTVNWKTAQIKVKFIL